MDPQTNEIEQLRSEGTQSPIESTRRRRNEDLPLADPIERIITAPKEVLIHRAASPRRPATPKRSSLQEIVLDPLPRLSETENDQIMEALLKAKLEQCSYMCHFEQTPPDGASAYTSTDALSEAAARLANASGNFVSPSELRNREVKRQALLDLIEHISQYRAGHRNVPESLYPHFFSMIIKNIFRPIPPPFNPVGEAFDPTEDEPVLDPAWSHLQLVYELLIRFIESNQFDFNLARRYIDQNFCIQLLGLFDVEDPRERDLLKTTLHRIYAKFLQLRAFIRRAMHNIFYEFVQDPLQYRHNISEMLEILGSIINGFALPLKDEHKQFLERTLLPLHKTRFLSLYFRQLDYCVVQFVEKDPHLASTVILGLLKVWPRTNSTKEVLFLSEIEEILELCGPDQFVHVCEALFTRLSACIDSNHFQVAERALMFWNNDHVLMLMAGHLPTLLPILLPVLSTHSHSHWNKSVQILVLSALESLMELDPRAFDACVAQLAGQREAKARQRQRQLQLWHQIDTALQQPDSLERKMLYRELSRESQILLQEEEAVVVAVEEDAQMPRMEVSGTASPIRDQRRKSILPINSETFNELLSYSRTPSPTVSTTEE